MINFILSSVLQLTQPQLPTASTLCVQQVVAVNGQPKLDTTIYFLHSPTHINTTGDLIGASTSDRVNLTPQQAVKANKLHENGVCATPLLLN